MNEQDNFWVSYSDFTLLLVVVMVTFVSFAAMKKTAAEEDNTYPVISVFIERMENGEYRTRCQDRNGEEISEYSLEQKIREALKEVERIKISKNIEGSTPFSYFNRLKKRIDFLNQSLPRTKDGKYRIIQEEIETRKMH